MNTIRHLSRIWLLALFAAFAAALPACGEDDPSFEGCVLDDGSFNCGDAHCAKSPECQRGCQAQVPTCEASLSVRATSRICDNGECADAGPRASDGSIRRGNLQVQTLFNNLVPTVIPQLRSFAATVHHRIRPGGGTLSCDDLLDLDLKDLEDPTFSNIVARRVARHSAQAGDISKLDVQDIPITTDDQGFVIFVRFFTVNPTTDNEPQGDIAAKGCIEGIQVPEGAFEPDEAHSPEMRVSPACDARDPDACTDGKVCVAAAGMCRHVCEPSCTSSAQVCRPPVAGAPAECLRRCYPDRPELPACPVGERCDSLVGEEPACLPAG